MREDLSIAIDINNKLRDSSNLLLQIDGDITEDVSTKIKEVALIRKSLEDRLTSILTKYDLNKSHLNLIGLFNYDGESDSLIDDLKNYQGDTIDYVEESVVVKALQIQQFDDNEIENIIKGTGHRNLANLVPVKRRFVTEDGVMYEKIVYVKRIPIDNPVKSERFIAQHETEANLQVGDKVQAHFIGYSTNRQYSFNDFSVERIDPDSVVLKFDSDFHTGNQNGYIYSAGQQVTIPLTNNPAWKKETSFKKVSAPQSDLVELERGGDNSTPQPQSDNATPTSSGNVVTSIDQISVGDIVLVKDGEEEKQGEITYIHPQGNFIDIKVDGVKKRRRLGKFSIVPTTPTLMSLQQQEVLFNELKASGLISSSSKFITPYSMDNVPTVDTTRQGPPETYQVREQVDRFGNPNRRGQSWRMVTRTRSTYYKYTDEERQELYRALIATPTPYDGCNFSQLISEMATAHAASFPNGQKPTVRVEIDKRNQMSFGFDSDKMNMTRNFSKDGDGNINVSHSLFKINSNSDRGGNLGKSLFKSLYRAYRELNIKKITVHANISVGGYAWGRYGFHCTKSTAEGLVRNFSVGRANHSVSYTITAQDRERAHRVVSDFYAVNPDNTPFPVNLLCCIGPDNKAGKTALLGNSWQGFIDLHNDTQRAQFENYINSI